MYSILASHTISRGTLIDHEIAVIAEQPPSSKDTQRLQGLNEQILRQSPDWNLLY